MQNIGDKYILIGATSGLGWEFFWQLPKNSSVLLVGRMSLSQFQIQLEKSLVQNEFINNSRLEYYQTDLSKSEQWSQLQEKIKNFSDPNSYPNSYPYPAESSFSKTRIFYFAGGGPYGAFSKKKFSDHMWAMNVSFLAFASILHFVVSQNSNLNDLQIIAIGSAVAESKPDYQAASYSAAKHALKGLVSSIQLEYSQADIRLFSPGYMQTKMLPPMAWVYQLNGLVASPKLVASILSEWSLDPTKRGSNLVLAQDYKS